ncbi:MAG: cell division protein FtsX [Lysobacteraceae bacterium]|nr:MAG: cell division protein FtsX [Xanthomonadaceae bacterium]
MFKPLELFVGLRYTRSKRSNNFISFISIASMAGIALGVAALITVISVMNGFETELRERILGMVSHATLEARDGLTDWPTALEVANQNPSVVGAAPYIEQETMMQGRKVTGAIVRGVDPQMEPLVSEVADQMLVGSLDELQSGEYNIVLGIGLAIRLRADVGDSILVYAPQIRTSAIGVLPQVRKFKVVGVFEAGMHEYDSALAFMHMDDAARLFRLGEAVSGIRLKLDDLFAARRVARELTPQMPEAVMVVDWTQRNANFFRAVKMEKTVMFVILSLIVGVAAFNIVSTLVMVVQDKRGDIAILRTLGASPASILGVFMVQGILIGVIGTLLGTVGGIALASNVDVIVPWLERQFSVDFLSADVYYITDLPSELKMKDVLSICGLSFVLSALATLYPAWRGARTDPAAALRYE